MSETGCPTWEKFLADSIGNSETIELLRSFMRAHLSQERFGKALVLLGPGGNGKTVLSDVIKALSEKGFTESLETKDLSREFYRARLYRKDCPQAVLVSILDPDFVDSDFRSSFKSILSGEQITASFQHKPPFLFIPLVNFVFSTNSLPLETLTAGVHRRLALVRMEYSGPRKPLLIDELMTELNEIRLWVKQ